MINDTLRCELEKQNARRVALIEEHRKLHKQELALLGQRLGAEREQLAAAMGEHHQQEKQDLQEANRLAVEALREAMRLQSQQQLEEVRLQHGRKMADLQVELAAEHEREKKSLRGECGLEIQRHRGQVEKLLAERNKEVSFS